MRNIVITAKAFVTLPDDATINADGSITINGNTFKDICISVSLYKENESECKEADVLKTGLKIEPNTNLMDANKTFQRIW